LKPLWPRIQEFEKPVHIWSRMCAFWAPDVQIELTVWERVRELAVPTDLGITLSTFSSVSEMQRRELRKYKHRIAGEASVQLVRSHLMKR
jgi:hypothetical protein